MQVYLADDGTYRSTWSHKTLIPTEEQLGWFAMLDAAANAQGYAELMDGDYPCTRMDGGFTDGRTRIVYCIKGSGTYIGDKEC